jgi:hypothetical protein
MPSHSRRTRPDHPTPCCPHFLQFSTGVLLGDTPEDTSPGRPNFRGYTNPNFLDNLSHAQHTLPRPHIYSHDGPTLHYPPSLVYSPSIEIQSAATTPTIANVCGSPSASLLSTIIFSYTTTVVNLGQRVTSLEVHNLPIVPVAVCAICSYHLFLASQAISNTPWVLAYKLFAINRRFFVYMFFLAAISAVSFYAPAFFL